MSDDPDKLLPLDAWHRAHAARMVPFAGYSMPVQYEGIIAEHRWTREAASLFDVSHMGQIFLAGRAADLALEALIPADVGGMGLGQLRYSLLLDDNGGIIDDLIVSRWREGLYLVVNGATKQTDLNWLQERLSGEVAVRHLEDRALLALQGPKAVEVLARHARVLPAPLEPAINVATLDFMTGGRFLIDGTEAWISRSGYTGEDGFEISLLAADAERIADLLVAQPEVRPAGLGARDSLRLEAGLPLHGHDIDLHTDPVSAGLAFAIARPRRAGSGFPGAAIIERLLAGGPEKRRVGLLVDGRMPAREGAEIFDGDAEAGCVSSGGYSPTLDRPIAMGWVAARFAEPGTRLQIEVRGKRLDATVTPLPFVPHRYHREGAAA